MVLVRGEDTRGPEVAFPELRTYDESVFAC